jgi:hypothetical protein
MAPQGPAASTATVSYGKSRLSEAEKYNVSDEPFATLQGSALCCGWWRRGQRCPGSFGETAFVIKKSRVIEIRTFDLADARWAMARSSSTEALLQRAWRRS